MLRARIVPADERMQTPEWAGAVYPVTLVLFMASASLDWTVMEAPATAAFSPDNTLAGCTEEASSAGLSTTNCSAEQL